MCKKKVVIDDGFNPELVETAYFDGFLEMPRIEKIGDIIIPDNLIPFSQRNRSIDFSEFICFYEHDTVFSEVIKTPEDFLDDFKRFRGIITTDCSLYLDMPLLTQMMNTYRNRALGHYFQSNGIYVIPNVRWGDERSFEALPDYPMFEKFAFLGLPKDWIVSIGTHGCIDGEEERYYFSAGLGAMLQELTPQVVLVYGRMPDEIFAPYRNSTRFVHYPDWIAQKRKRAA